MRALEERAACREAGGALGWEQLRNSFRGCGQATGRSCVCVWGGQRQGELQGSWGTPNPKEGQGEGLHASFLEELVAGLLAFMTPLWTPWGPSHVTSHGDTPSLLPFLFFLLFR